MENDYCIKFILMLFIIMTLRMKLKGLYRRQQKGPNFFDSFRLQWNLVCMTNIKTTCSQPVFV